MEAYFQEFAEIERSDDSVQTGVHVGPSVSSMQYKNQSLRAPADLAMVEVTSIVDHQQHKSQRVDVRHVCREKAKRRCSKKTTFTGEEEEEEQPSKKRRRLQRKQITQPEPHVQLDPSEQLAEQTASAEDTGK